ncbi:hypothetical protein BHS06_28925 [Myxococcus xanthus]|nr:hypothetical protein BHS06_28925 [Myxococcus xanthus]
MGGFVEDRAQGPEQRGGVGISASVAQIEGVVEVRRVLALVVLQEGLQFVEGLHRLGFGRLGPRVLVPEGEDALAQGRVESAGEVQQVGAFPLVLVRVGALVDGGNIAVDGFAQVVDHAHPEELERVQAGERIIEREGHQAQPPGVFGGALRPSGGGMRAPQHVFQLLRFAEEVEATLEGFDVHGEVSHWLTPRLDTRSSGVHA